MRLRWAYALPGGLIISTCSFVRPEQAEQGGVYTTNIDQFHVRSNGPGFVGPYNITRYSEYNILPGASEVPDTIDPFLRESV